MHHMDAQVDRADAELARIARNQHGIVTFRALVAAGIGRGAIAVRVRRGSLHRIHRGVYSLTPALSDEARWMAAVLACGDDAVLSHSAAAALWRLSKPIEGAIDVSVPSQAGRKKREGICLHRCPSLASHRGDPEAVREAERRGYELATLITIRDLIPVTTVPRTLADLRGTVPSKQWRNAVREAEHRGYHLGGIETDGSNSDLETYFLAFCRRYGFPRPEVNAEICGLEVDFLWRAERLVVETDDYTYHRGFVSFESDHERDLKLRRAGYTVLRYTGAQLRSCPAEIAAELGEVLLRRT
jgi:Transcriptional regulator, AbiEi antitoxin/Protein of unknown function (DUF559)